MQQNQNDIKKLNSDSNSQIELGSRNQLQQKQRQSVMQKIQAIKTIQYEDKEKKNELSSERKALNEKWTQLMMVIITLWSLFADDIRASCLAPSYDLGFSVVTQIVMIIFFLEIVVLIIFKEDYFMSFYFFLDILSTVSLILDISYISDSMLNINSQSLATANNPQKIIEIANISQQVQSSFSALRVIRIVRLIRLVKLYQTANKIIELRKLKQKQLQMLANENTDINNNNRKQSVTINNKIQIVNQQEQELALMKDEGFPLDKKKQQLTIIQKQQQTIRNNNNVQTTTVSNNNDNKMMDYQETNVGKKLSELIMMRLICIVMAIIFTVPIFNIDTYQNTNTYNSAAHNGLYLLDKNYDANPTGALYLKTVNIYSTFMTSNAVRSQLITLYLQQGTSVTTLYQSTTVSLAQRRITEIGVYQGGKFMSITDEYLNQQLGSILSIVRTVFVSFVLVISIIYFNNDTTEYVVGPIEVMLDKVKKIGKNPLEAAHMEEQDAFLQEKIEEENKEKVVDKDEQEEKQAFETNILQKTIIKIGGLLALGFGEAGSGIIAANMAGGGDVNPMLPGKKQLAVFGFCDIRNFTDATEILQEGVMLFVNEIAEITHGVIDRFCGAANKNIGDAFLLVWKYSEDMVTIQENGDPKLIKTRQSQQFSDLAFLAFVKNMAAITLSNTLKKYRKHEGLNRRMPNYSVKMGYGLHFGFGIEGSIGSVYKIDASYLSPNVNMASRLEAATKQFGVPLLISGGLLEVMTKKCNNECRKIDRVTVKGSTQPIDLYTCDLDLVNLEEKIKVGEIDQNNVEKMTRNEKKIFKFKKRMKRDQFKIDLLENNIDLHKIFFEKDEEVIAMRETFSKQFKEKFEEGFDAYLAGNWEVARKTLIQVHALHPHGHDGPTATILSTLEEYNNKAPISWKGYRELTEK